MEVCFFGRGPVASRCLAVLRDIGIKVVSPNMETLWLSVHWPKKFLSFPLPGILNLHNSYLPWNRGANACSWAIAENTPHGVTMHWCDEGIDTGPIFMQRRVPILPEDTADTLYQRTAEEEVKLFRDAMDEYRLGLRRRMPQDGEGSSHRKADFDKLIRAVTTNEYRVLHV